MSLRTSTATAHDYDSLTETSSERVHGAAFGGRRQRADHSRPDEYQYFFFVPLEARTEAIVWHAEKNLPARVDGDVDEAGAMLSVKQHGRTQPRGACE